MDMILEFISDKPWFGLVAAIIAGAAAFCAATPTPKPGTWISKAYTAIEFLALNIGKAKAIAVVEEKVEEKVEEVKETVTDAVTDALTKAVKKTTKKASTKK